MKLKCGYNFKKVSRNVVCVIDLYKEEDHGSGTDQQD